MIRKVFIAAVLAAVLAVPAFAQRGGGGGGPQGGFGGGRGQVNDKSAALTKEFKLTPEQKAAFEAIMDEAQKQFDPVLPQITELKNAMLNLALTGKSTDEAVQRLALLNAQIMAIEVNAFNNALTKLDNKQKEKAPQLFAAMAGMFGAPGGWRKSN